MLLCNIYHEKIWRPVCTLQDWKMATNTKFVYAIGKKHNIWFQTIGRDLVGHHLHVTHGKYCLASCVQTKVWNCAEQIYYVLTWVYVFYLMLYLWFDRYHNFYIPSLGTIWSSSIHKGASHKWIPNQYSIQPRYSKLMILIVFIFMYI